ncbi:MAG: DUF6516 family protein [Candidatus Bipolaricaulia bacterium]
MPSWYRAVRSKLEDAGIFTEVEVIGAKVRGWISEEVYLDIYYDPTSGSYSYALIDRTLSYPGDKRLFGWDDYPHENVEEIKRLKSYPDHFQRREGSRWVFEESPMRGDVRMEIGLVVERVKSYLEGKETAH